MRRVRMQMLAVLVTVPLLMGSECPDPGDPDYLGPEEVPAPEPCAEFSITVEPYFRQVRPGDVDVRTVEIRRLIPGFVGPVRLLMPLETLLWSGTIDPNPVTLSTTSPTATSTMTLEHSDWGSQGKPGSWDVQEMTARSPLTECTAQFETVLGAAVGDVVFEDDFDVGNRWEVYVSTEGEGQASHYVSNRDRPDEPGGFRYMEHRWEPGPAHISVQHYYTAGTYTPRDEGAIETIYYSEDRVQFDPPFEGAAIGTAFLLEQKGADGVWRVYSALLPSNGAFSSTEWERATLTLVALTPEDFTPSPGPDFEDGGKMYFGYRRSNTNNGASSMVTKHGIDNWWVAIHRR